MLAFGSPVVPGPLGVGRVLRAAVLAFVTVAPVLAQEDRIGRSRMRSWRIRVPTSG